MAKLLWCGDEYSIPSTGVNRRELTDVGIYAGATHLGHVCYPGFLAEEELDAIKVPTLSREVQRLPPSLERCFSYQQ